jgi:propionyl-CoA carboxylase alpha chain
VHVRIVPGDAPEDEGPHPDAVGYDVLVHGWIPGGPTATGYLDVEVDGHRQRVAVARHDGDVKIVTPSGRVAVHERPRFPAAALEEVAGATLAPMPGAVVTVAVEPGQTVSKGDLLVTVEAMKMEHRVTAPFDGVVGEVRVTPGQQVDADAVLVVVEEPDAEE